MNLRSPHSEGSFDEAGQIFDLVRLQSHLEVIKHGTITPTDWKYFKGILCGKEVRDIAELCCVQKGTIYNALNKRIKPYLYQLLERPEPEEETIDYSRVSKWLLDTGYGLGENWQQVCRAMLDRQIQFPTLNDLMAKDGVRIDPAKLFVPVGLVERRQKQYRRSDIGSAEQGSQLLQPTEEEIVKRFDHEEDFFSQVIGNSDISKNSRLVITGEPGAGKTTLLQKIGDRLYQEGMFPIWVSLGKYGVPPSYKFLNRVLKESAQPQKAESLDWNTSISALLQTGKVWLLLDGADELTTNGNPLQEIGSQLREAWASQVKVVLTCRLNAWDIYALPEFKVFRTLEFDCQTPVDGYRNQIEAYIHQFFTKDGVDPQLANALIQQLHTSGKERIRDSVKNPLRLALLCYIWETGIGELPDTKAELYRLFVYYYYDLQALKHPEIRIDRTERDALNLALGEIAKAALDNSDSRFRIRKSLIESTPAMGKSDAEVSLFAKAIHFGWLNYIGTTAEKPCEAVYAFFHASFQEYFAALAIDNHTFFIKQSFNNRLLPENERFLYRIAEKVIIPYLEKGDETGEQKTELVKLFSYLAGFVEVNDFIIGGVYRIFEPHWREVITIWFGRDKSEKDAFIRSLLDFEDFCGKFYWFRAFFTATEGIAEFKESLYSDEIVQNLIRFAFGFFDASEEIWLRSFYPLNEEAKFFLLRTHSTKVVNELEKLLDNCQDEITCWDAARHLALIDPNHSKAVKVLVYLIQSSKDINAVYLSLESLEEIGLNNKSVLPNLLSIVDKISSQKLLKEVRKAIHALEHVNTNRKDLELNHNEEVLEPISNSLIHRLIEALQNDEDQWICRDALLALEKTFSDEHLKLMVFNLNNYLPGYAKSDNSWRSSYCYRLLWHCAQNMSYANFYRAWHSSFSADDRLPVDN